MRSCARRRRASSRCRWQTIAATSATSASPSPTKIYAHLKQDVDERRGAQQHTDVVTLDASLLELVTESGMHLASIRFSGLIREGAGQAPQQFEEIWNLQKPETGGAGWMLAGIQQVS